MVSKSQVPADSVVRVPLGDRSYRIEIGSGGLSGAAERFRASLGDITQVLLVCDASVAERWAEPIRDEFLAAGIMVSLRPVPAGEPSKSVEQLAELWAWMLAERADRRTVVAALGGGVVGDLAGFAAASFARGLRFVQLPTTLLSMVDSSVGGKTGINLPGAKNMVGAFWQPSLVLIDTETLATLPDREFLSGLAEVVKYGVIDDAEFFEWLESNAEALVRRDPEALRWAIAASCQSKARVVAEDERETSGRRAILNYGHTFAHAIEATEGYGKLLHGEAVSIGMQMAARLAVALGRCDPELAERQTRLLSACRLPVSLAGASPERMLPVMMRDKKVAHGRLRFILPRRIGEVEMVGDIEEAAVRDAILAASRE